MAGFGKDNLIKDYLGIPDYMNIQLLLSVGYEDSPQNKIATGRIETERVVSFNSYNDLSTINPSTKLEEHSIDDIIDYRKRIAPVYLDRYHLASYNKKYYKKVAKIISKSLASNQGGKWLDLMTYDGEFLKQLSEKKVFRKFDITVSDYLQKSIDFVSNDLETDGTLINNNNELETNNKFGVITYVLQADFTPQHKKLIKNACELLEKDGYFYIAVLRDRLYKRIILKIKDVVRKLERKRKNVYEGSPYYKIGPKASVDIDGITDLLRLNEVSLVEGKKVSYPKNGTVLTVLTYKK
jgi:hypothetical protein